jgi:hypothetical protein
VIKINTNFKTYIEENPDIDNILWQSAIETKEPDFDSILKSGETQLSRSTMFRWKALLRDKYNEYRTVIEEQEKMSLKLGMEASANLAGKFVSKDYDKVKDRIYNLTRGRFMESWEVDLSKIVPDEQCPIPDPMDDDDPDDDPRIQVWRDMCDPRYDSALDPDYEKKRQRISEDLSGFDEVIAHFDRVRKQEREKMYNDFENVFGPDFHE